MSTRSPPSSSRSTHPSTASASTVRGSVPPKTAVARSGSSVASGALSTGKSAAHKSPVGPVSPSPKPLPQGSAAKSASAASPTPAPKAPAARHHLTNKDGVLERVLQAKARLKDSTKKAESSAPAHSPKDAPVKEGGTSTQNANPSHAAAAGSRQNLHGQAPLHAQVGDHKGRQAVAQPGNSLPLPGELTHLQRLLAQGLSHQASTAVQPKSEHPRPGSGAVGLGR